MTDGKKLHIPKPSLDDFVFEGETTPWLLRKRVVLSLVAAFALVVVAYFITANQLGISYEIDAEPFQEWVEDQGIWGPIVYMLVLAASVLVAPIPNAPIFIAAGLAWGPILGTVYSLIGMLLGSAVAFWLSRWIGRKHLPRLIGSKAAKRIDEIAETIGGKVIFWARMLPVLNFDWVSFVAGLTAMRFRTYFVWSAAGMVLPTSVAVIAGDGLGRDVRITILAGGLWVAGVALSAAYFWWRHRRWRKARRAADQLLQDISTGNPDPARQTVS